MIAPTPFRIWLSIALTVIDTQAVLVAMFAFAWAPTHPQLYALAGIAVVLLTMMGFDVLHSIAEFKAAGLASIAAMTPAAQAVVASTASSPPLSPAVPMTPAPGGD